MVWLLASLCLLSGCSGPEFAQSPTSASDFDAAPGAGTLVRGEPEHLDAAVRYAASRHGLAVTSISATDDERVYELVSVRDEPCWLWVTGLAGVAAHESGQLVARAQIGRFGASEREREFEAAIGRRLASKSHD